MPLETHVIPMNYKLQPEGVPCIMAYMIREKIPQRMSEIQDS